MLKIKNRQHFNLRKWKKNAIGFSFVLPNFIGFMLFVLIPILFSVVMSFFDWKGRTIGGFVGLGNYIEMFHSSTFITALKNTLVFAVMTVPLTLAVSLAAALLLNQKVRGLGIFRTIYFFPNVTAVVALGAVWNMIFNPDMGIVNTALAALGVPAENLPRWSSSTEWSLFTVVLAQVWKNAGYYMVIFLAGLQNIPRELYEAARIDGAKRRALFCHITLPLLSPTTFFVLIMLTISSFQTFEMVDVITAGGPGKSSYVLSMYIYRSAFTESRFGYAAAISMMLFVFVALITLVQLKAEQRWSGD